MHPQCAELNWEFCTKQRCGVVKGEDKKYSEFLKALCGF